MEINEKLELEYINEDKENISLINNYCYQQFKNILVEEDEADFNLYDEISSTCETIINTYEEKSTNEFYDIPNFIKNYIENEKIDNTEILNKLKILIEKSKNKYPYNLNKQQEDIIIDITDSYNIMNEEDLKNINENNLKNYLFLNMIFRHKCLNDNILSYICEEQLIMPYFMFVNIILNKSTENSNYIYKLAINQNIDLKYLKESIENEILTNNKNILKLLDFFNEFENLKEFINLFIQDTPEFSKNLNNNINRKFGIIYYMKHNKQELKESKIIENSSCFNSDNTTNNYIISDIHGDLSVLLNFIISAGLASYNDKEPSFKYYNISTGESSLILEDIINPNLQKKYTYIRIIPNLNYNKNLNKNYIINGDLIDRGYESEECFYTVLDLIENQNCDKLIYILGNHEFLLFEKDSKRKNKMTYTTNIIKTKIDSNIDKNIYDDCFFNEMSKRLINAIEKKYQYVKACHRVGNILISHTSIKENILKIISDLTFKKINDLDNIESFINIFYKININYEIRRSANIDLKTKYANKLIIKNIKKHTEKELNRNILILFWNRDFDKKTDILQIIGHEIKKDYIINDDNKFFIDLCRNFVSNKSISKFNFILLNSEIKYLDYGNLNNNNIIEYFTNNKIYDINKDDNEKIKILEKASDCFNNSKVQYY